MPSKYEHLFFDLDHTLWDFDTNSREALKEIFFTYRLDTYGIPSFEKFHQVYLPINSQYWAKYHQELITKEQLRVGRFYETLRILRVNDPTLPDKLATAYIELSPYKNALFANTFEVLDYLREKYKLHIITNGFVEVQDIKVEYSGLAKYFENVFISERVGYKKPDKGMFLHALEVAGTTADRALMIGDNMQTDIIGARLAGIDQVFFNPTNNRVTEQPTYHIKELKELLSFL